MFNIVICSDLDHDEIVADICWNDIIVATVNQDKGLENLEIEIFDPIEEGFQSWNFPLNDWIIILQEAKNTLLTMQKMESL